ncbi:CLIP-associated protein [Cucurbita argyrosperma subsp. argyrosperma]|nr:CLIP-associated protein [Cucurbita argyrosperma subsp. argyrosperma]
MEEALELARAKDTKERMAGVERLYELLEASRKSLNSAETTALVDCCLDLLKDNNFRVSQGALQALASAAVLSGEPLKLHFNALVPAVVERLGDAKQPVREAARRLLLTLMEISSPTIIVERAGSYAWSHKSWRIREEFARTVTAAIGLFASTELTLQRAVLPSILQMLNDPNPGVREAAIVCIEVSDLELIATMGILEMYTQAGPQLRDELQRHHLPTYMVKDINARLEKITPQVRSSEGLGSFSVGDMKPANINPKKSSPKAKSSNREVSLFGGESDVTEKQIDPIKVYSEKELIREIEKIASILVPEKDWSIRIAAMQRIEGFVSGGAADYPCFKGLLKQLVGPLSTQLSDRRSSIVKQNGFTFSQFYFVFQACHLLCFLSKELLGDFEACAEMFIPVLFKLVVITVLVIAESADNCIKTVLCCEYALLILEYWADAPEIQRSADLYEDLIRCCVADAMSEVRATARLLYRMFAKTWPERSRRLFSSFDLVIQRLINEDDGGIHRRHASPSVHDRGTMMSLNSQPSTGSSLPGYGTSAIVAMDRSSSLSSGASLSSGLLSQSKTSVDGSERSLESVLHSSKQKVNAIESMLRGLDLSEKHNANLRSSSLDLGVDPPSSRDPPFPQALLATNHLSNSSTAELTASNQNKVRSRQGGLGLSDIITQIQASKGSGKSSYRSNVVSESLPTFSSYSVKRVVDRHQERGSVEENNDIREAKRYITPQIEKHYLDTSYRDGNYKDSHNSYIPNFQRPLLRKNAAGRMSATRRRSFDDSQLPVGEMSSYVDSPASLSDALSEGLNPSSDWCTRVGTFNYLQSLLQQGPKGIQEVLQNFEKVMKLFFQHLDDPHHKVAQAALSTLADIIPTCRRPFESYMERILPHVFSRLIDPKELVRQPCSTTLEIVSKSYSTDSLLPALLRSLDEQRSPKAKLAVIEFAINSFNKHVVNSDGFSNNGILKLWLAKLTPLVYDKNTKLKEAAITCIISVYSHFEPAAVLNYILSLSVEEQNSLRRALKQYTPRIEVDLMNFLQNKKERQRPKSLYDPSDMVGSSSEEGYVSMSKKNQFFGRYSAGSLDDESGRKWNTNQESTLVTRSIGQATSDELRENLYHNFDSGSSNDVINLKTKEANYLENSTHQNLGSRTSLVDNVDNSVDFDDYSSLHLVNGEIDSNHLGVAENIGYDDEASLELGSHQHKIKSVNSMMDTCPSIPQILHLISTGNGESPSASKCGALQQLVETSISNDPSIWTKYFNQILTVILEVLDNSDSSVREVALTLITEMIKNQRDSMEDSVEIVIEKLLHVTKDIIPKVSNDAENCLTIVLSQYDPFRCLSVIAPLLVTEDEKTLVTCINCLTKLVGRLSQEELMTQLPTFLPALFEAFGHQSADVRKTVVFCLVDIYIMLGKQFLPHLEALNSTQLRLVTIYANRISQARTGTAIKANHD